MVLWGRMSGNGAEAFCFGSSRGICDGISFFFPLLVFLIIVLIIEIISNKLFRILRDDEIEITSLGITAKNVKAEKTFNSHVGCGSGQDYASQFISCSTEFKAALDFAALPFKRNILPPGAVIVKDIAVIDWDALVKRGFTVHDLNIVGRDILTSPWAHNFAHCYKEALVERYIPPDCIIGVKQVVIKVENEKIQHKVHDKTPFNLVINTIIRRLNE